MGAWNIYSTANWSSLHIKGVCRVTRLLNASIGKSTGIATQIRFWKWKKAKRKILKKKPCFMIPNNKVEALYVGRTQQVVLRAMSNLFSWTVRSKIDIFSHAQKQAKFNTIFRVYKAERFCMLCQLFGT